MKNYFIELLEQFQKAAYTNMVQTSRHIYEGAEKFRYEMREFIAKIKDEKSQ